MVQAADAGAWYCSVHVSFYECQLPCLVSLPRYLDRNLVPGCGVEGELLRAEGQQINLQAQSTAVAEI